VAEESPAPSDDDAAKGAPAPARRARGRRPAAPAEAPAAKKAPAPETKEPEARAPRRAELTADGRRLLLVRRSIAQRRPIFGRQARYRYWRIGRDGAWRRPRGLQSKQRRHYGYRPEVVRIGYRAPASVRGLTPAGFLPVIVRNRADLDGVDPRRQAAVIARTIGTRLRLVLEERARQLGIHVLNPIVKGEREE
jgi:large subunit ribosomal protein L32e